MPWKCPGGGAVAEREREREAERRVPLRSHQSIARASPGRPTRAPPGHHQGVPPGHHHQGITRGQPGRSGALPRHPGLSPRAFSGHLHQERERQSGCRGGWVPGWLGACDRLAAWLSPGGGALVESWRCRGGALVIPEWCLVVPWWHPGGAFPLSFFLSLSPSITGYVSLPLWCPSRERERERTKKREREREREGHH